MSKCIFRKSVDHIIVYMRDTCPIDIRNGTKSQHFRLDLGDISSQRRMPCHYCKWRCEGKSLKEDVLLLKIDQFNKLRYVSNCSSFINRLKYFLYGQIFYVSFVLRTGENISTLWQLYSSSHLTWFSKRDVKVRFFFFLNVLEFFYDHNIFIRSRGDKVHYFDIYNELHDDECIELKMYLNR